MVRRVLGDVVGKCSVCTINLWSSTDGKPAVFPCNVLKCPYEDPDKQHRHLTEREYGIIGSGLGQIER